MNENISTLTTEDTNLDGKADKSAAAFKYISFYVYMPLKTLLC